MAKDLPLLEKVYKDPLYADLCRFVGCGTKTYRELREKPELLGDAYGKAEVEAAQAHLLTYDGQFTATP